MVREMKDSGIKWVGDIPETWKVMANRYLFKISKKIVTNPNKYQLLSLTTKGIKEKNPEDTKGKVPDNYNGYQVVEKNDLVMCLFDLDCSAVFSGLSKYQGMISPAYKVLKPNNKIASVKYFDYWFQYVSSERFYKQYSKSLRYTVSSDEFELLKSIVPSIDEQKKIAEFLDKKCGEIDSITADIQKQIENLERYKRSVITEAVTKGLNPNAEMKDSRTVWLGKIPEHWQIKKGKYIFQTRNTKGNSINLELLSPTQKYGVIPQSKYEELSTQVTVKVNEQTNLMSFKTIHKGDYCISLRSFEGGFEYSEYEGVVSPAYTVFYPISNIDRVYYKYLFKIKSFIAEMNSYSLSLRDGKPISFDDFGNTLVPVPSVSEQNKIVDYLDKKCAEIESVITDKKSQLETIEKYKKSLIYEYVTGKKEVL